MAVKVGLQVSAILASKFGSLTDFFSSKLLREMRARYLISTKILVAWLVDMLGIANLAQIGFITQLIGEHLPEISKHSSVARPCIRIVCAKLNEVSTSHHAPRG